MSTLISLNEVPQDFLDRGQWAELRANAWNDELALTYLNNPYPDHDNPTDFFWGRDGTFDQAVRCYEIGREMIGQCRRLLIERKLVAFGTRPNGQREMIKPREWADLWPMFATNRATGPNASFDKIEISKSTPLETPDQAMLLDCINWLRAQNVGTLKKKTWLLHQARSEIGANLTHAIFNAAYKAVVGRLRGRPKNGGETTA
jgi:hypothetical protein